MTYFQPFQRQNAPGFAFFGSIRVRFSVLVLFWPTKSWGLFLCRLPHGVHRLKSLVVPVRREVSVFVFTSHKNLAKTYLSRTCIEKVFLSLYITSSCYIIKTTVEHSQRNICSVIWRWQPISLRGRMCRVRHFWGILPCPPEAVY